MKFISSTLFTYITKIMMFLMLVICVQTQATEVESTTVPKSSTLKKAPVVIKSQVKGSQEQPNVIYILPWQSIKSPISIEGNTQKIVLPHFKPINPKVFKQQARAFYQENSAKQAQESINKGIHNETNKE